VLLRSFAEFSGVGDKFRDKVTDLDASLPHAVLESLTSRRQIDPSTRIGCAESNE
jgi:hypothetical protein